MKMIENGLPCNIRYEKYIELFLVRLEMRTIKSRLYHIRNEKY